MIYSDAWGKLIHEKNQKSKISWHCPFKRLQIWALVLMVRWVVHMVVHISDGEFLWILGAAGSVWGWGDGGATTGRPAVFYRIPGSKHRHSIQYPLPVGLVWATALPSIYVHCTAQSQYSCQPNIIVQCTASNKPYTGCTSCIYSILGSNLSIIVVCATGVQMHAVCSFMNAPACTVCLPNLVAKPASKLISNKILYTVFTSISEYILYMLG